MVDRFSEFIAKKTGEADEKDVVDPRHRIDVCRSGERCVSAGNRRLARGLRRAALSAHRNRKQPDLQLRTRRENIYSLRLRHRRLRAAEITQRGFSS